VTVYKANMIIPQIQENLTQSDNLPLPERCPACGMPLSIHNALGAETLVCENPDCPAKKIKSFTQFVSRDAMNIDGLSEMTLEKLIGRGFIHRFGDLFRLKEHRDEIMSMEGFGKKSCENLEQSIENARETTLPRLLFALGIPNIGVANARGISQAFDDDLERVRHAGEEELKEVPGVGDVMAKAVAGWFEKEENRAVLEDLLTEISLQKSAAADGTEAGNGRGGEQKLKGKTFVITGSVSHFAGRRELKELIERQGGKVTGSVSKKTDYLINNDPLSKSSKNKSAGELGIPILTEEDFLKMLE
jgi:DNA ligase (NAD+)